MDAMYLAAQYFQNKGNMGDTKTKLTITMSKEWPVPLLTCCIDPSKRHKEFNVGFNIYKASYHMLFKKKKLSKFLIVDWANYTTKTIELEQIKNCYSNK